MPASGTTDLGTPQYLVRMVRSSRKKTLKGSSWVPLPNLCKRESVWSNCMEWWYGVIQEQNTRSEASRSCR